jgi:serine/threonine protein kinase
MTSETEDLPTAFGRYEVRRVLGAGGMGVVYLAASPSGRQVAVKVIRQEHADDSEFRTRFRREVDAARRVSGAFTAPVVEAAPDADPPWMATLYIHGVPLDKRVKTEGPLALKEVWQLACGLVEALRDIHRAELVHRDLKPANILLTDDGPRVIDFGIARTADIDAITRTGKFMGTPSFMAPEQWLGTKEIGPAADVFALGSTLVYAASGHGPFDADLPVTTGYKITREEPDLDGVPNALHPLIESCLAKDPAQRPSPDQLLDFLNSDGRSRRALGGYVKRKRRRAILRATAGAALLAVATTAAVWWVNGSSSSPPTTKPDPTTRPSPTGPAVEPVAGKRPQGWALFETRLPNTRTADTPWCGYFASALVCASTGLDAARVDPGSGKILWSRPSSGTQASSGNLIGAAEGLLVIRKHDDGALTGLDLMNGQTRWTSPLKASSEPVMIGSTLYVTPDTSQEIAAIDVRTGQRLPHSRSLADTDDFFKGADNNLYLSTHGDARSVSLLDPVTLRLKWTRSLPTAALVPSQTWIGRSDWVWTETDSESLIKAVVHWNPQTSKVRRVPLDKAIAGTVTFSDDRLYVARRNGDLNAIDLTSGKTLWSAGTGLESPGKPVMSKGHLYTFATNAEIVCLNAESGLQQWRSAPRRAPDTDLAFEPQSTPIVTEGVVYAAAARGTVFAITPPSTARS